ncbi:DegT/DnrJ/EryC1/StrS family aminotransferase [Clostridium celatum]|uniref:DegT/DnrJ/EryC1/StrS family aminotransferase n=1 Tax=Clostridium celatum TaxID=36834 RepID=UPI00319DC08B
MYYFKEPIQVTKAFLPPFKEYIEKIQSMWSTNWITNNGCLHNELENKIANYLGVNNATLFTNGHLSLDIAIKALNIKGEVITTPFTFPSTTHAIVLNNLKPVFCDINKEDFTIDVDKIEELITDKTSAIIPVHVFGYPCDVEKIEKIAKDHNLKVIYDAAHVFGVEIGGIGIGNFGDISMFSLHATKVYNSIEGGILAYNNSDLEERLRSLKNFGYISNDEVEVVGLNAKMNEFQAAMGLCNLKYVDDQIKNRKEVARIYREQLEEVEGVYYLNDKEGIKHNYSYFPILVDEECTGITRDELHESLKEYNIYTRKYFYPMIPELECYKGKYNSNNLNVAKYVSDRVLTLPIYGQLNLQDAYNIANNIKEIILSKKNKTK